MPRFRKKMKEPSRPELLRLTEKELANYPYPWDVFRHLSEDELDATNNPADQRLIDEEQLREKRRTEEKEDQAQLKKRRARSAARAARTRKRRARQSGK